MQWVSNLYKGMATPFHAAIGILGVCIVAFSFAGALGGFMEKFTYAVFFLYGIFLFYCAFFSRLLVEANRLEDNDPKREKLVGLSYVYQGVLIPVILVMTWWMFSTALGNLHNLIVTVDNADESLIREFEHMTMGAIEYDLGEGDKNVLTLKLSGFLPSARALGAMIEYQGSGKRAKVNISVPTKIIGVDGYEIFSNENPIELVLDVGNSVDDKRPYKDACYIRIPILKPDLGDIPRKKISLYSYHDLTLSLLRDVSLKADNGMGNDDLLIGDGFLMIKYSDHSAYDSKGSIRYCSRPMTLEGEEYFSLSSYKNIPVKIYSEFLFSAISKNLRSFSHDTRLYIRSWSDYQYYLKSGFENILS